MVHQKRKMCFIVTAVLLLTAALVGCGSSGDGVESGGVHGVTEWAFYSAYGPDEGAACEIWPQIFDQVEEATDGKLKITIYWYGQHPYEGEDMLKALQDKTCELSHFYSGYVGSVEPVFGADAVPMLFPSDPMESWKVTSALWGNFEQNTDGALEKVLQERWNATMVHMLPASPQRIFTNGYTADGVGSLKGHKIRVYSPELGTLVSIMGGTPVSVSFSEVYTSLSTNLIDGYITSVMFAESGGLFDFTSTINKWEIAASTDGVIVSLDALNSLEPEVKEAFLEVMRTSANKPETLEMEINDEIEKNLNDSGKVQSFSPSQEQRDAVITQVEKQIWEPWIKMTGEDGEKVIEQIEQLTQ